LRANSAQRERIKRELQQSESLVSHGVRSREAPDSGREARKRKWLRYDASGWPL
jgi:hypothetical protein